MFSMLLRIVHVFTVRCVSSMEGRHRREIRLIERGKKNMKSVKISENYYKYKRCLVRETNT